MALETPVSINDLNPAWPAGGDQKGEGDNHIRNIKAVLQNAFPFLSGKMLRSVVKTANYTVQTTDGFVMFDCAGTLVFNIVAAATLGVHMWGFYVRSGSLQIDPNASELINGASTVVMTAGTWGFVFCDGSAFTVLANSSLPANSVFESTIADGSITPAKVSTVFGATLVQVAIDAADYYVIADASNGFALRAVLVGGSVAQNAQAAGYTFAKTDAGKHIYYTGAAANLVIPTDALVAMTIGDAVTVVNAGSGALTVTTTGITLKMAGTTQTGNRTIAVNGMVTFLKVAANTWFVSGAGLS